jgi:hypothetical protein
MRTINNYDEFVAAIKDKSSEDRVVRNEAKNALAVFHSKYPGRFDEYKAKYEGFDYSKIQQETAVMPKPTQKEGRRTAADKEQFIKDHPKLNVQKLRNEAREKLLKGSLGFGLQFDLPKWVTVNDVLISLDQLDLSDLLTTSGKLAARDTLRRKCIKRAAAEGRIDEKMLREYVLSQCTNLWQKSSVRPDYPFESVKWFILKVATAEELAVACASGISMFKQIDIIYDRRIPKLNITELKEKEKIEIIEKLKRYNPSEIRRLAKKAGLDIFYNKKKNPHYLLPENCKIEDLKAVIDKISEDELWAIFDGQRVNADALYTLCIEVIGNFEQ